MSEADIINGILTAAYCLGLFYAGIGIGMWLERCRILARDSE